MENNIQSDVNLINLKKREKWIIVSFIWGIIGVLFLGFGLFLLVAYDTPFVRSFILFVNSFVVGDIFSGLFLGYLIILPPPIIIMSIIGLIFSIRGLKSSKKRLAIAGIILNTINIVIGINIGLCSFSLFWVIFTRGFSSGGGDLCSRYFF